MNDNTVIIEEDNKFISLVQFLMLLLIVGYLVIGAAKKSTGTVFGHEASYIVAIGFLISLIGFKSKDMMIEKTIFFDENVLFYFCIPPIVFAQGFHMRRKRFF